uniref:Uncharacterized protein n=1 Tax=Arundo donax TaxID=35708 RepID=A0A0A8XRA3_ARUDO
MRGSMHSFQSSQRNSLSCFTILSSSVPARRHSASSVGQTSGTSSRSGSRRR